MASNLTKEQRAARRRRAWSLRQKGWTEQRIADDLGVNQSTVSRWLDATTRRTIDQLDALVMREFLASLGLLDHTIDEAMQAWDRSKKPRRRASKKSGPSGRGSSGEPGETTTAESTDRDGDPAFLTLILSALDRKRQLLALDDRFAPPRQDDDRPRGDLTVADALTLAESRDDAYRPDGGAPPDGETPDDASHPG